MATTAPKPAAKAPPKGGPQPVPDAPPPAEEEAQPPKKSKTKLLIIVGAVVLLLAGSGIGAWLAMGHSQKKAKPAAAKTAEAGKISEAETAEAPAPAENAEATEAAADSEDAGKQEPLKPPVFLNIDQFTVNLQPEGANDQFLQISITLQVADENQVELIKEYMPQVRSRLLMLLSSKKASEISSTEGKKKLADEITAQVKQPFSAQGSPQSVSNVFFTSFVIQ